MLHVGQSIKDVGGRNTEAKLATLAIILRAKKSISAEELKNKLQKKGVVINKSTLYRQLNNLVKKQLINVISKSGVRYYENNTQEHHHHVICVNCQRLAHIKASPEIEKIIQQETKDLLKQEWQITNHNFEFAGLCKACQKLAS